jgi:hypothetical protein
MGTEFAAIKERQRLKKLEEQITDMLPNMDHKQLIKRLDYGVYSGPERMEIITILLRIRASQAKTNHPNASEKLQKLINHYAIEHRNMVVLKPGR